MTRDEVEQAINALTSMGFIVEGVDALNETFLIRATPTRGQ